MSSSFIGQFLSEWCLWTGTDLWIQISGWFVEARSCRCEEWFSSVGVTSAINNASLGQASVNWTDSRLSCSVSETLPSFPSLNSNKLFRKAIFAACAISQTLWQWGGLWMMIVKWPGSVGKCQMPRSPKLIQGLILLSAGISVYDPSRSWLNHQASCQMEKMGSNLHKHKTFLKAACSSASWLQSPCALFLVVHSHFEIPDWALQRTNFVRSISFLLYAVFHPLSPSSVSKNSQRTTRGFHTCNPQAHQFLKPPSNSLYTVWTLLKPYCAAVKHRSDPSQVMKLDVSS